MTQIKIVETFLYNGDGIAPYHLGIMYPYVDHFFIVEARETFSGHPKAGLYSEIPENRAAFAPFMDKITFLIIDRYPDPPAEWLESQLPPYMVPGSHTAWFRDVYSHEYARAHIRERYDPSGAPYIVIAGDADEIPNPAVVQEMRRPENYQMFHRPIGLTMRFFHYSFDWEKPMPWYHPTAMNREGLANNTLGGARMGVNKTYTVDNAGWHCSYFCTVAEIQRKIASFAHREYDDPVLVSTDNIEQCRCTGRDISNPGPAEDCTPNTDYGNLPPGWERYSNHKK